MTTRCKFRLNSIKLSTGSSGKQLVFETVYDPSIPEDKAFTKYTPNGVLAVSIDNPVVEPMLILGGYYYLDISPVPEPTP